MDEIKEQKKDKKIKLEATEKDGDQPGQIPDKKESTATDYVTDKESKTISPSVGKNKRKKFYSCEDLEALLNKQHEDYLNEKREAFKKAHNNYIITKFRSLYKEHTGSEDGFDMLNISIVRESKYTNEFEATYIDKEQGINVDIRTWIKFELDDHDLYGNIMGSFGDRCANFLGWM